jgi:hypothetical protein
MFTLEDLDKVLKERRQDIVYALMEYYEDDWNFISLDGNTMRLSSKWDDDKHEVQVDDTEEILKLGYDRIIKLVKKLNIFEPLPEITFPDLIRARMINFAKDVISPIIDTDNYEVRLTDGDGGEDSYYIVCFIENSEYQKRKKDADSTLSYFKVIAETNVIFQLSMWPKAQLNLTGSHFGTVGKNSEELLRGIFLSHYYFANVELQD